MNIDRLRNSNNLLFIGLMMLAAGLPVSLFLTSLSQFFIAGSFFIEGSFEAKFRKFLCSPIAILIVVLWLMHVVGLMWTTDLQEGLKDIRIKLPLLLLPLVLSGSEPLSKTQFTWILRVFVGSVLVGSMVSIAVYFDFIHRDLQSIRDIFIFNVSHIRFALFLCLSVFILFGDATKKIKNGSVLIFIVELILILWFIYFLVFIESITGILILIIAATLHLIYAGLRVKNKGWRLGIFIIALIPPLLLTYEISNIANDFFNKKNYPINENDKTARGNAYTFSESIDENENGYPIWAYVCEEELRPEWNKISSIDYDSLDERGQSLRYTLIRFLSSKGLRKDAEGLKSLNTDEIKSIESGIANVSYQNMSNTNARLLQIVWEFDKYSRGYNPSGHSVTQRFEFWKAAIGIIKANPLLGVGTGDMPQSYKEQYISTNSSLKEKYRLRAHNQYLAIGVGLGVPALLFFIFLLIYSILYKKNRENYLFRSFWIIAILSMLTEDTLETQSGATFFAFFLCLFLFAIHNENRKTEI